jgi:hypothetical protein
MPWEGDSAYQEVRWTGMALNCREFLNREHPCPIQFYHYSGNCGSLLTGRIISEYGRRSAFQVAIATLASCATKIRSLSASIVASDNMFDAPERSRGAALCQRAGRSERLGRFARACNQRTPVRSRYPAA